MYETIRVNVDEEEQWKVFDFVEDFFMEELEIGDYINDINSYHLHMFGKHDVTTKKLDVIVEKAGKVDANYAAQIEGYCSLLGEYGKKFETVCAMLALDLIGVKVFRYSDETAEAVASGEKLLKESQTVYESFADMMSPEDAKRYLDFLENGSREGLTSAELADALLVSQKVGYEDVWDLRNVGDALESGSKTIKNVEAPILPEGSSWERNVLNSFAGGKSNSVTYGGGTTLYRVGGKNGGFWSLDPPPATEYQWRVDTAIKQEFCNDASTLYKMTIPEGAKLSGLEGKVGSQGMGLYGGAHQVYIDYKAVPSDWIEIIPMQWK